MTSRSCDYPNDQKRLIELWLAYRTASDVRMYPTIWRIRLLLTSRVWEPEKDSRVWQNASGQIIGFAMLWRRQPTSPYLVLDGFVHPLFATESLLSAMLQWGDQRAYDIVAEQKIPLTVYANGFLHAGNLLDQFGFAPLPPNPDEHNVYFTRSLKNETLTFTIPSGYTLHRLQETDELESFQSLYGFAKVNPFHQKELLESEEYCHLVVVDPGGELVAYCECSICRAEWKITHQQIGWIDYIETRPEHQKQGLGRVATMAGLTQLQEWGADTAMLVTVNTNLPAVSLYNKTGFERVEILEHLSYKKEIALSNW
jgi:ribosomal protein S18 acetylase RimI-like enzyme